MFAATSTALKFNVVFWSFWFVSMLGESPHAECDSRMQVDRQAGRYRYALFVVVRGVLVYFLCTVLETLSVVVWSFVVHSWVLVHMVRNF